MHEHFGWENAGNFIGIIWKNERKGKRERHLLNRQVWKRWLHSYMMSVIDDKELWSIIWQKYEIILSFQIKIASEMIDRYSKKKNSEEKWTNKSFPFHHNISFTRIRFKYLTRWKKEEERKKDVITEQPCIAPESFVYFQINYIETAFAYKMWVPRYVFGEKVFFSGPLPCMTLYVLFISPEKQLFLAKFMYLCVISILMETKLKQTLHWHLLSD